MCLEGLLPIFPEVDNFKIVQRTTDLELIRDSTNPILRVKVAVGATFLLNFLDQERRGY